MKQPRSIGTFLSSPVVLLIEVCIFLFIMVSVGQEVFRRKEVHNEVSRLQKQISQLEDQNIGLAKMLGQLSSDSKLETEARRQLDVEKQGETVVLIPKTENSKGQIELPQSASSTSSKTSTSNPERWWSLFFHS